MSKGNINFKQIRKKVIQQPDPNIQNTPINPASKVSFRGIKRRQELAPIQLTDSSKKDAYLSPIKINSTRNRVLDGSKEECNKFSVLLESKGYANGNSGRKKSTEISFRTLTSCNNSSRTKLNTERSERVTTEAEYRINVQPSTSKADTIQQKCRQIKQKQYFSSRPSQGQLNSLNKLKTKLISPLKKKSESQPEQIFKPAFPLTNPNTGSQKIINIFEHSSILSEHDLVNMSKNNQSIDFDMSPFL